MKKTLAVLLWEMTILAFLRFLFIWKMPGDCTCGRGELSPLENSIGHWLRQDMNQLRQDKNQLRQDSNQLHQDRNQLRQDMNQLRQNRSQLRQDRDQLRKGGN